MERYQIKKILINDIAYAEKLRNIYDPPKCLYIIGNESLLSTKSIAMIGCRNCSQYGANIAYQFAYELAKKNITIISGLARGIDTCSHWGAVNANGKTIAILGSGLDIIYPSENKKLYDEIIKKGGAIISEYPLGTKPEKYHFPARNRIISGLSNGVFVIEARNKSGTLITVDHALEQGKDIYAVPGDITRENSIGTNELIKQGAIPITCVDDFVFL